MSRLLVSTTIFIVAVISSALAAKRWYYTGVFTRDKVTKAMFEGSVFHYNDIFTIPQVAEEDGGESSEKKSSDKKSFLYAGGLALTPFLDVTVDNLTTDESDYIQHLLGRFNPELSTLTYNITSITQYQVELITDYALHINNTDSSMSTKESVLEAEIGLFDHNIEEFVEKKIINLSVGNMTAVKVYFEYVKENHDDVIAEEHQIVINTDMFKRLSLAYHTSSSLSSNFTENIEDTNGSLRVMTYNLWHNNPPSWVYTNNKERWELYQERIKHFCDVIVSNNPDIVTLQEVRLDGTFFTTNKDRLLKGSLSSSSHANNNSSFRKIDAGSQVEHLLVHLNAAIHGSTGQHKYYNHVVFHPGMSMLDRQKLAYRNEEGVMILSKYPLKNVRVLFLPRNLTHPNDDHQRVVLVADAILPNNRQQETVIELDNTGDATIRSTNNGDGQKESIITIGTTHLSLLESSRDLSYDFIAQTIKTEQSDSLGFILTGDLNAEPHEKGLTDLIQNSIKPDDSVVSDRISESFFVDSWLAYQQRNEQEIFDTGYTFPASSPVKRIDFILARNNTNGDVGKGLSVATSYITGQDPTAKTVHLVGSREDLGMLDTDSPTWASDHFAVVTDFIVKN